MENILEKCQKDFEKRIFKQIKKLTKDDKLKIGNMVALVLRDCQDQTYTTILKRRKRAKKLNNLIKWVENFHWTDKEFYNWADKSTFLQRLEKILDRYNNGVDYIAP